MSLLFSFKVKLSNIDPVHQEVMHGAQMFIVHRAVTLKERLRVSVLVHKGQDTIRKVFLQRVIKPKANLLNLDVPQRNLT